MAVIKGTEGPPAQTREGVPLEVLMVAMTGNIVSSVDLTVSFGGKRCETFMRSMTVRTVYGTLTYLVNGLTRKDMKAKAHACNISFYTGRQMRAGRHGPMPSYTGATSVNLSVFLLPFSCSYRSSFVIILLWALWASMIA